jgi:hypothetical protein
MPDIPKYKFVDRLRPPCSRCGRPLLLTRIEPEEPDFDLRMYYCAFCEDNETVIAPKEEATMASSDANVSSPPRQAIERRTCENCSAEMKHLSDLPSLKCRAAIRIFCCYFCNNVVSEDW